jgi:hypothetical protein
MKLKLVSSISDPSAKIYTVHTDRRANNNNQTSPTVHATGRRPAATTTGACGRDSEFVHSRRWLCCAAAHLQATTHYGHAQIYRCVWGGHAQRGGFAWMMAPQRRRTTCVKVSRQSLSRTTAKSRAPELPFKNRSGGLQVVDHAAAGWDVGFH